MGVSGSKKWSRSSLLFDYICASKLIFDVLTKQSIDKKQLELFVIDFQREVKVFKNYVKN